MCELVQEELVQKEIEKQINVYKSDKSRLISDYEKEQETFKEYNGRQVLELLQNADDEKSEEVLIKLNSEEQILEISNKGKNCNPFSICGIKSLMLANFSPKKRDKNRKNYIGNKGLGFRSVVNWSEQITIYSNNLKIDFSYDISKRVYKEKTGEEIDKIAFLSLPKVEKVENSNYDNWTTTIIIKYKKELLDDILKQLYTIKDEVLLFVNHIEKLTINIDGKTKNIERIKENNQIYLNDTIWTIFEYDKDTLLPKEYWENEEPEHFDLKIAVKENLDKNENFFLYSFFPTEINTGFPFITHGTFELDSSRNNIIDSKKNRFILDKLVDFIVDTAKKLTKDKVDYTALEFLTHNSNNERLRRLGFYEKIEEKINDLEIFPCLDNTYKKRDEVVFVSDEFSEFIEKNNFQKFFPNMLISSKNSFINPDDYDLSKEIDLDLLDEVSKEIKDLDIRVELIYLLEKYFNYKNYKFEVLIDEDGKIIS
ncbi:sacsin N-terminal ATP-binding-like domain-containing protein, partial [Persephonella sp.]